MHRHRKIGRLLAVAFGGGCLLQLVGCATGLIPTALSFVESAILSALLGGLAAP
jgi:hypothetical protein